MSAITYPKNIETNAGDYVKFEFGKYDVPYNGAPTNNTTSYNINATFTKGAGAVADEFYLPMPSDIGSSISGNWGGKDVTSIAGLALGKVITPMANVAKGGGVGAFKQGLGNLFSTDTLVKGSSALAEDALKELGNQFANLPGMGANLTANDVLALTSGSIINPNTELLYGGTGLRQHGYTFKLVPTSQAEAENVIKIVESFKKAAAPKKGTQNILGANVTNFIGLPDVCRVTFLTYDGTSVKENPYLPNYKISAINSVSVDYVVDGNYASFRDGRPVGVSLTIALTELKLLFADEMGEGTDKYR